ncbi:hypothetical protein D3C71_1611810 [compost metagenome]
MVEVGIVFGFGVRLAVFPGEEERQQDDGNNDDQHQHGGQDDQITLLRGDIACGVENYGFAAAAEGGDKRGSCEPRRPTDFLGLKHVMGAPERA